MLACNSSAQAHETYTEILVGIANSNFSENKLVSNNNFLLSSNFVTNTESDSNTAIGLGVGIFANKFVGAEFTYKHFGRSKAYSSGFLFRYQPIEKIQLIGKFGGAYVVSNGSTQIDSSTGLSTTLGLAVKYSITESISLGIDYTHMSTMGNSSSTGYFSGADIFMSSVSYTFGK